MKYVFNTFNKSKTIKPQKKLHKLNIPLEEYSDTHLFSSSEVLYKSSKNLFFKFLQKFRKITSKKANKGNKKRNTIHTLRTGRKTKIVKYNPQENIIAPIQTIINSLHNGRYKLKEKRINVKKEDFVGWKRAEKESLTLVLVVDVSKSTRPFMVVFREILKSLTKYFNKNNDRIGLISLQGSQAKTLNHPTHNFRVIIKSLSKLNIYGETPLADGLLKSLDMVKLEKFKKPGSKSLVLLISDCYPEPLTKQYEDIFDEPAYKNTLTNSILYKNRKVNLLVINPCFMDEEAQYPGEKLSQMIADNSNGKLIKLITQKSALGGTAGYLPPTYKEIEKIVRGIEDTFSNIG